MDARDRIQDMLCERIENLETVLEACKKMVDGMHTSINMIENSRSQKERCGELAHEARQRLREIVTIMEGAAP